MDRVIVSRHPAAIEFVRKYADLSNDTPVITGNATPDDVRGKHVFGVVPFHLAAEAAMVTVVEFTGNPPRGQEYTLLQMEEAGARLTTYKVVKV